MDHSNASGQRAARSERINATPYRRPQPRASASPFSTVRNIISYALSPLFRRDDRLALPTTTQDVDMEPEARSESGSEDNWDSPEARREDIFSAAAQYTLEGVEERSAEWQARGEIPGGRRDTARRSLAGQTPTPQANGQVARPVRVNGNAAAPRTGPRVFSDQFTEEEEREIGVGEGRSLRRAAIRERHMQVADEAFPPLPDRPLEQASSDNVPVDGAPDAHVEAPTPEVQVPADATRAGANPAALAAAATALATFIEGKRDQATTPNDWIIIDAMVANIRAASSVAILASMTALSAFLDGKRNQTLNGADVQLIKALTDNMKTEAGPRLGGWSAGTPRPVRPLPNRRSVQGIFTPARDLAEPATPRSSTSLANGPPTPFSSPDASQHRVTYLGPGMSPRRMLGRPRSSLGLRPLFAPDPEEQEEREESVPKRRRTEDGGIASSSSSTSTTSIVMMSQTTSTASSSSTATPPRRGESAQQPAKTLRHPLSQSFTAEPSPDPNEAQEPLEPLDAVTLGRRRAADIMRTLIREEVGPLDAPPPPEEMIINPYDTPRSSASERSATPSLSSRNLGFNSPRHSVLRATLKQSPKRGAAAKLEATKGHGRQLTALEVLTGKKPWEVKDDAPLTDTPSRKGKGKEVDRRVNDRMDVDRREPQPAPGSSRLHKAEAPRPVPKAPSPQKRPQSLPEPEPFKPFEPPMLDSPSRPLPRYNPAPPTYEAYQPSPSVFGGQINKIEPPKFTLSAPPPAPAPDDPMEYIPPRKSPVKVRFDPTVIYYTAKEQALQIDKPALPFFTFTLPPRASGEDTPSVKEAKALALKAPLATFHFSFHEHTLPAFDQSSKTAGSNGTDSRPALPLSNASLAPAAGGTEWTCSLCMLKNPASATEKCTICEAPRPTGVPANKATTASSGGAPTKNVDSNAEWTCSMCMLKNPGSAKEKCTICEEPRR